MKNTIKPYMKMLTTYLQSTNKIWRVEILVMMK